MVEKKLRPFVDADGYIFERFVEGHPAFEKIDKLIHRINNKIDDLNMRPVTHDLYKALNPAAKNGNKVASLIVYIHEDFPKDKVDEFIKLNAPFLFSYSERFLERGLEKK